MLQLKNHTPFQTQFFVFPDIHGIDTLYVVIKGTFTLCSKPDVAENQIPVVLEDEYWGQPENSSIKFASEVHLTKPGTDVALVGDAWSPNGRPVGVFDASLRVGNNTQHIRIFGDRIWKGGLLGPRPSPPRPVARMPLQYEYAFGGTYVDDSTGEVRAELRNPVGRGFVSRRGVPNTALPNLEDPGSPVKSPGDRPLPMGFGFISPSWEPRKALGGTYDATWQKRRAPYLPTDFNERFFHAAHPAWTRPYLQGGEPIELCNLVPQGVQPSRVPAIGYEVSVKVAGEWVSPKLNLETLLLLPNENIFCLSWRGCVPCDKRAIQIERIDVKTTTMKL